MATTDRPSTAPTDKLERHYGEVPDVPDGWQYIEDRSYRPHNARAAWTHRETGQIVTVERNRRPTQMHDPMTSDDDVGYNARVCRPDTTDTRNLSYELGQLVDAWHSALRFMAKYSDGDYEIPELDTWDHGNTVEW